MTIQHFAPPARRRLAKGFTLIELLVVIAIIAILAAILFPVFAKAREKARQTACLSGEKQMGLGFMQYIQDNDETMPLAAQPSVAYTSVNDVRNMKWMDEIFPYVKSEAVYHCPDAGDNNYLNYVYYTGRAGARYGSFSANSAYYSGCMWAGANTAGVCLSGSLPAHGPLAQPMGKLVVPADTVLVTETGLTTAGTPQNNAVVTWNYGNGSNGLPGGVELHVNTATDPNTLDNNTGALVIMRHSAGVNVVWCDGHAKWSTAQSLIDGHTYSGHTVEYHWTVEDD